MPMVSATDIPLQPYPTGRTSPQAPSDYQQIPTSPQMFGSIEAEALQQAGQQGEKLATSVAQIGAYRKRQYDLNEADKLSMRLDDEILREKHGDIAAGIDPDTGRKRVPGYLDLAGAEAINRGLPDLSGTIQRIAADAPNDEVRQHFLHLARARRAEADLAFTNHYDKQTDTYNKNLQEAKGAQALRDGAINWNDDNAIAEAANKRASAAYRLLPGADAQTLQNAHDQAHAKVYESAIDGALAAGDENRARQLYEANRNLFAGQDLERITQKIESAGERGRARDEKKQGEDYERWLSGEGPRPIAPGARTRAQGGGGSQETLQADFAKRSGAFGTPEEAGQHITSVTSPGGATFRVHDKAAPQIQGFISELEGLGYKIDPATSGGYNNRNKVGVSTSEKSEHAYGTAIDINTDRNKQADTLISDLPANVGQIAAKWGLKWGGTFTGKKDAMHFEVARLLPGGAAEASAGSGAPDQLDNWETQNNNFGGIRKKGADPNATTAEGGFETYPTPEAGVQAIADNLRRYAAGGVVTEMNPDGKPLNTIRDIVSVWAPPSQNDTNALIGRASRVTGFKPDQVIDLKDPATMAKVIEATIRNEQGGKLPVAPAIITRAAGAGLVSAGGGATSETPGPAAGEDTATPAAATPVASAAATEPKPAPDWAALAQRIRNSDLAPGAKTAAFRKLEERKQMFEFGKQDALPKYNAQVHAAVEQRIDDIVQGAARSDDPGVRDKAAQDLTTIIKWGVDSGAIPANKGYEAERTAKAQLITGRAQYLDAGGKSDEALALIQQNKDALPPAIYQEQVRNLTGRAETQQGTRFEREMQISGGPGYVPGVPTPGMLPGASAESQIPTAPSPFQQKLQAIADSDLPDGAKKAAHAAALSRHELEVVGQDRAKSDLDLAIRSGAADRVDIEQAYREGRIAPSARTEMHNQLDKIDAEKNAAATAMATVNAAGNGGAPLDPKSDYNKKAINYHFDKVSAAWPADEVTARSLDYAAKYGMVPERFKGLIRGSLHSGSPAAMVAAADAVNQLRNRNPQLVGELGDENDLRLATLLHTYTDAGIRPEQAVELATSGMKVTAPDREARSQQFDIERGKSKNDQHDADTKWLESQLNSIWRPDPDVDPTMRKEFEEVSRAEYQRTGNLEASRRMALDNINNVWGRTRVGGDLRYMKQAPEKYYGVPTLTDGENATWMNEQLASDIGKDALQDPANPITSARLHLVQAPDRTARDGRPAYQVWLEHPTTKAWELVTRSDGQARVWAPDWATSAEKQRRDAQQAAEISLYRLQRGMQGVPGIPLAAPGMF